MVDHPEFLASAGLKTRLPTEDYVASVRSLGVTLAAPTSSSSFVEAMYDQYRELGQAPYEWPSPNGYPEDGTSWSSAGRVLTSFAAHRSLGAQYYPTKDCTYRTFASWLPTLPASLDTVLTYVGTQMLCQTPSAALKSAVAQALGLTLDHQLTATEATSYWTVRTILASMLDSPQHLHR